MNYIDPDVCCPQKVVKLKSLTHAYSGQDDTLL